MTTRVQLLSPWVFSCRSLGTNNIMEMHSSHFVFLVELVDGQRAITFTLTQIQLMITFKIKGGKHRFLRQICEIDIIAVISATSAKWYYVCCHGEETISQHNNIINGCSSNYHNWHSNWYYDIMDRLLRRLMLPSPNWDLRLITCPQKHLPIDRSSQHTNQQHPREKGEDKSRDPFI